LEYFDGQHPTVRVRDETRANTKTRPDEEDHQMVEGEILDKVKEKMRS
jgi:hypothetical protein